MLKIQFTNTCISLKYSNYFSNARISLEMLLGIWEIFQKCQKQFRNTRFFTIATKLVFIFQICFGSYLLQLWHNLLHHTCSHDEMIKKHKWSYLSVVCGTVLGTIHPRTPAHFMLLHQHWIPKYVIQHYSFINNLIFVDNVNCTNNNFILWTRLCAT